ncbi:MAG: Lrp/AsnC family transcriptional regulator [Candidatus Odinarchaeota archaeon]
MKKEEEEIKIEKLDLEILGILNEDSRLKLRPIAERLKKSPTTINKHINELEDAKIIKNYSLNIDYEKLGFDIIALIELTISKGKMIEIERGIAQDPHIFGVYDITGEYDAVLLARFKTRKDLNTFVKNLNSLEYIVKTNTHLVLNVIKERTDFNDLVNSEDLLSKQKLKKS